MMDPLSYFSFQPVFRNWCNKGRGMCYPVYGMMHIKNPQRNQSYCSPSFNYFSFQPEHHDWINKGRGQCYPLYGMVHQTKKQKQKIPQLPHPQKNNNKLKHYTGGHAWTLSGYSSPPPPPPTTVVMSTNRDTRHSMHNSQCSTLQIMWFPRPYPNMVGGGGGGAKVMVVGNIFCYKILPSA